MYGVLETEKLALVDLLPQLKPLLNIPDFQVENTIVEQNGDMEIDEIFDDVDKEDSDDSDTEIESNNDEEINYMTDATQNLQPKKWPLNPNEPQLVKITPLKCTSIIDNVCDEEILNTSTTATTTTTTTTEEQALQDELFKEIQKNKALQHQLMESDKRTIQLKQKLNIKSRDDASSSHTIIRKSSEVITIE